MPPLLQRLTERKPENLDYLGVSYGLTSQLLRSACQQLKKPTFPDVINRFWKRAGYVPLYIRQTQSELTGEHTVVMVRGLRSSRNEELGWLGEFSKGRYLRHWSALVNQSLYLLIDFRRRFLTLLSFKFREFNSIMGLSVLEAANIGVKYLEPDTPSLYSFALSPLFLVLHLMI